MDDYAILEVSYGVTEEELKKAFRRLSMLHHPDRPGGNAEKYKKITAAYAALQKRIKNSVPFTPPSTYTPPSRSNPNSAYGFYGKSFYGTYHSDFQNVINEFAKRQAQTQSNYATATEAMQQQVQNEYDARIREKLRQAKIIFGQS